MDGGEIKCLMSRLQNGKVIRNYKIFYRCQRCGHGGEVKEDIGDMSKALRDKKG